MNSCPHSAQNILSSHTLPPNCALSYEAVVLLLLCVGSKLSVK